MVNFSRWPLCPHDKKIPRTPWREGRVGPRASLHVLEARNTCSCRYSNTVPSSQPAQRHVTNELPHSNHRQRIQHCDWLRAGQAEVQFPAQARDSSPKHPDQVQPAFHWMGTGTTTEWNYTSAPLYTWASDYGHLEWCKSIPTIVPNSFLLLINAKHRLHKNVTNTAFAIQRRCHMKKHEALVEGLWQRKTDVLGEKLYR